MEREKSWEIVTDIGKKINYNWKKMAEKYDLSITIQGLPALTSFTINSNNWLHYKTFLTQEMLKNRFLASNTIYVSTAHSRYT